jgi:murein DD-endopeptidase MepM/ murein hydrolase activator NlpD
VRSASLARLRFRPATVLAVACALALAAPAAGAVPEYDGGPVVHRAKTETFAVPLRGPLYERFGYDRGRLHAGIDIAVLGTDAVRAALPGVVTAVGYLQSYSGYGNVVKIRHGRGMQTMYAHLATAAVRVGEAVQRGQVIARAGCTGSCTGPHLHFEVRVRGRLVDPLAFLPRGLR